MAESAPRRMYLSDLVMQVLFCGLVVATIAAPWETRELTSNRGASG